MSDIETVSRFCRNCLIPVDSSDERCSKCESVRIAAHPELDSLSIAHLDCDAFYAAIEKRDDPSIADKPLIIGGGTRGVVSTCCYIARTYGIHSAMPMFKALKACPNAVVIPPAMKKYSQIGRQIRQMMENLTPLVEPLSIDEAFMDMTGTQKLHGMTPAMALASLQNRIAEEVGVTVSIGLSHNKYLAKIASDFDKPNGFFVIGKAETMKFLANQPINLIWGVGKVMTKTLERDGLTMIGQLQAIDEATLAKRYGELGLRLYRLSRGLDVRKVEPSSATKSVSNETTFNKDTADIALLEERLWLLCENISSRMKKKHLVGRVVTLKLKTADFKTVSRRKTLDRSSNLARIAYNTAKPLLHEVMQGQSFRLIGVGYADLSTNESAPQVELFESDNEKLATQERAIDEIRAKFGDKAISAARTLKKTD